MANKYDGFRNQETLDFWEKTQEESRFTELVELAKPFIKKRNDRGFTKLLKEKFPNEVKKVSFNQVSLRFYSKVISIQQNQEISKALKDKEKYNGWPNRETWAMSIHLDNDYGFYIQVEDLKKSSKSWQEFSDKLKDFVKELEVIALRKPTEELVGLFFDVGSLWRVDFDEIAKSMMSVSK